MAEWLKAAVLKTAERKLRGFKSYSLRQNLQGKFWRDLARRFARRIRQNKRGEVAESAEGARLLSE
jgi:hypothetical protein